MFLMNLELKINVFSQLFSVLVFAKKLDCILFDISKLRLIREAVTYCLCHFLVGFER